MTDEQRTKEMIRMIEDRQDELIYGGEPATPQQERESLEHLLLSPWGQPTNEEAQVGRLKESSVLDAVEQLSGQLAAVSAKLDAVLLRMESLDRADRAIVSEMKSNYVAFEGYIREACDDARRSG